MDIRTIETTTHGRYLVEGPPGAPMLVGFHGYMENAAITMDILRRIVGDRAWLMVSVQGLHRFYNRGHDVVIANWMTSEDRELAIADNIAYVKAVLDTVRREYSSRKPVVFVGFSQGVAMAYRAAAFAGPGHGLILLAGDVPPDVSPLVHTLPPILLGRGAKDDWYTPSKAAKDVAQLKSAGVQFEEFVFDGGHEWDEAFMTRAQQFLTYTVP
jgi:predicted esterase